ncbi:MAG: transglutaminase-like domain-containing protein, partial [Verrucomicrobiota bacterium]|nr:transglutaminase-like domain-containing protein [Verrucomicrobiota bacterium]
VYLIHDPTVIELAKRAVRDAKSDHQKVERLVRFVSTYIIGDRQNRPRDLRRLIEVRRGMCTEYALLFTALARASGIPARQVIGLVYSGDDARAFGGHAWNEIVLDGKWVPVDASMGRTRLTPAHIRLRAPAPDDPYDPDAIEVIFSISRRLSFRVLELRTR